jgi:hypothetical protein
VGYENHKDTEHKGSLWLCGFLPEIKIHLDIHRDFNGSAISYIVSLTDCRSR